MSFRLSSALIVVFSLAAAVARAQTPGADVDQLSLRELLDIEVVATASKFPQQVTEAPASITIVTAEEIRRYGHRTLSDVLEGVRGLYVSYDRNYSYVGVRGFARPGDYNTRVLLLVNGHRLNDPAYDMGPIGTDMPLDIELIERVEIIRGPGSALYGSNAFFATVNIITRTGRQEPGVRARVEGGSLETYKGHVSAAHVFENGVDLLLSGSLQDIDGASRMYFPEFDTPDTAAGVVNEGDDDEAGRVFAAVGAGPVTIRAALAERHKRVPTAAFATVFGDTRFATRDSYALTDVSYSGRFGRWTATARGGYDRYHYRGDYPYDYGDAGVQVMLDVSEAEWLSAEMTLGRRLGTSHHVTVGSDGRYGVRERMYTADPYETLVVPTRVARSWGAYAQDEWSLTDGLVLSGGVRVDQERGWGHEVTPRAALIYSPRASTALKLMHGRAFRAPNGFERYYYSNQFPETRELRPETIHTSEAAWEQYYGRRLRSTVSLFHSRLDDLITQTAPSEDRSALPFTNALGARSTGIEAEIEGRWSGGFVARASHAFTSSSDRDSGERLTNAPAHLAKLGVIVPVFRSVAFLGMESSYTSARRSLHETELPSVFLQNVTLSTERLRRGTGLSVSVYNLFDTQYSDPGAEEHVQAGIPQDGRTVRVRFDIRF